MAQQQKKKETAKKRKPDNRAYPARDKHPDKVLRRIIQSSGFAAAQVYAEKYELGRVLAAIQTQKVLGENGKFRIVPVQWIERKKAEVSSAPPAAA
ncbi:MAG: hypothetical protein HZB99_04180 [Candidatus Harrisonbacteria bacterium]|nr:hypothetical protein [Candidatus Harrisonbacteria bacterium]